MLVFGHPSSILRLGTASCTMQRGLAYCKLVDSWCIQATLAALPGERHDDFGIHE